MFFGKHKKKPRRQEVRRQMSGKVPTRYHRFRQTASPVVLVIALAFAGFASLVILVGGQSLPYRGGQRLAQDAIARVAFEVPNPQSTERLREEAAQSTPNVFRLNQALLGKLHGQLNALLAAAKEAGDSYEVFAGKAQAAGWKPTPEHFEALKPFTSETGSRQFARLVDRLLDQLKRESIVEPVDPKARKHVPSRAWLLTEDDRGRLVDASLLQTPDNTAHVERTAQEIVIQFPGVLQPAIAELLVATISPADRQFEPVYLFDRNETSQRIQANRADVAGQVDVYEKGDVLATGIIDDRDLLLLQEEHKQYLRAVREDPELRRQLLLSQAGQVGLVLLLTLGLCVYTVRYQNRIAQNPYRAIALAVMVLLVVILGRQVTLAGLQPELAVGAVVLVAAIVVIIYGQRYALFVATVTSLMATMAIEGQIGQFLTMITAAWTTVLMLREIRTRSKLAQVGVAASVGAFIASGLGSLVDSQQTPYLLTHAGWAAASTFMASLLIQGVLPLIERLFKVATSMTLLEWTYASRPLLRRLAQEAPGTNSHSLLVASLAEAAADGIGCNGLLAKVGALYHDIGKIHKPDYFTENQEARMNRHDGLTPTMSLMIIRGHVKDGIELAKEYGLPNVLVPFIAEHHGTTLVRYFHHRASEQQPAKASGRHDREVSESEFRYPGPKPQSKESAILMICDGVEGAVRSLQEPSPVRIENVVHHIVMNRLNDGQFDDCDITLKELHRVEDTLVKTLSRFYHGRVTYPKAAG